MPCSFGVVSPIEAVVCAAAVPRLPITGHEEMNDQRVAETVGDPLEGRADE